MKTLVVNEGQSIIDIALQTTGSIEGLFDLLELNGLSINAVLTPGQILNVELPVIDRTITDYLQTNKIVINTGADVGGLQAGSGDFNNDFSKDFLS